MLVIKRSISVVAKSLNTFQITKADHKNTFQIFFTRHKNVFLISHHFDFQNLYKVDSCHDQEKKEEDTGSFIKGSSPQ